ncbi:hypothetical protein U9M48_009989 [Paspalum notatum var. saurae]|uniref:KxDL domain-containing protein n=1 Tax=Paspalum notatum var. saurae TaxID=547442 RepID=A0AAQ3SU19_PASNO
MEMGGTRECGGRGEAMEKPTPEAAAAAAEEVSARFRSLVDPDDIASIRQTQHLILGRLQDSNAVLSHFNEYSEQCFAEVSGDFANKTRLLKSMKADLDHIFTKLRGMKARLAATYPDAFPDGAMSKTMDQRPDLEIPLD